MVRKPPIGRSIGSLVPQVTRKALEKFGFPAAAILTDWPLIAGADIASFTAPERLKWPRSQDPGQPAAPQSPAGATLVLRAEGPRALELQFGCAQLIERINAHFGFLAVTEIRLLQAPLSRARATAKRPAAAPRLAIATGEVTDERLRDALERLGGQVKHKTAGEAGGK